MTPSIRMMYHPSHWVPDLEVVDTFFQEVFGRESVPQRDLRIKWAEGYPRDYSLFTPIADLWFDSVSPSLYVVHGEQVYPDVSEPQLRGFGWYVDEIEEMFERLRSRGFCVVDQLGNPAGSEPPLTSASSIKAVLFWVLSADGGMRYEFAPFWEMRGAIAKGRLGDMRQDPEWRLAPVADDDPLGIERCAYHTVLTRNLEGALELVVDGLGGVVISEGENPLTKTQSTYVALADAVYEYVSATPSGTPTEQRWSRRDFKDTYDGIAFKVVDLERVERQLQAHGVRVLLREDGALMTVPEDSIGIPWTFTEHAVAGDTRI